jgi:uncharacterized phage protein (TIGR02218 family)
VTWLQDEQSIEDSKPREGFEIVLPSVTYRLTSADQDLVIDGKTYRASPIARGELGISAVGSPTELAFTLPVSHALAQRYLLKLTPPKQIHVTVWRKQVRSGEVERVWAGYVTSMAVEGRLAHFRVPEGSGEIMLRRIPSITVGRQCPHVLYDDQCQVDRNSFDVSTTVLSFSARTVTVASIGGMPNDWAKFGELLHVASGERMTVLTQTGTALTIQAPIGDMAIGDAVFVYAGCNHSIIECHNKFANRVNFGGFPSLPSNGQFSLRVRGKNMWDE